MPYRFGPILALIVALAAIIYSFWPVLAAAPK